MVFFDLLGNLAPKNNSMDMFAGHMSKLVNGAGAAPRASIGRYYII